MLSRNNGTLIELKPLHHYELVDGDRIMIGAFDFEFHHKNLLEESEVFESSQSQETNSSEILSTSEIGESDETREIELVPATEDLLVDREKFCDSQRLEDIEIPSTEEMVTSQNELSQDILTNFDEDNKTKLIKKLSSESCTLMDTRSFSDDISEDVKMKKDSPMGVVLTEDVKDEILALETQPFCRIPPSTRKFSKLQNEIKPKTRSLDEFELTQADYGNYFLQTQPFMLPQETKLPVKLEDKMLAPNLYARRSAPKSSKKLNSILMSSSEESNDEIDDNESEENRPPSDFPHTQKTPKKSPINYHELSDTPELLPKISSQIFMNSEFLDRVNSSQPINDDTVLDFKAEEEEVVEAEGTLKVRTSFKRHAEDNFKLIKKRFKMKYASDEEN